MNEQEAFNVLVNLANEVPLKAGDAAARIQAIELLQSTFAPKDKAQK